MLELAQDGELRRRLGEEARRRVKQHFLLSQHVQGLTQVYDDVLAGRPAV